MRPLLGVMLSCVIVVGPGLAACGGKSGGGAARPGGDGGGGGVVPAPASGPAWFVIAPTQAGNGWEGVAGEESIGYPIAELEAVHAFLAGKGVKPVSLGYAWTVEPIAVCEALSCPRGDEVVVLADAGAAETLAGLGFARVPAKGFWSLAGAQCESAWGPPGEPLEEAKTLAAWLGAKGAQPEKIGFVWESEAKMRAQVCGGARGMAAITAAASEKTLVELGFSPAP